VILVLVLVVVLLGAAGAGLLGIGVLSADARRERSGLLAVLSAPVVVLLGAAVIAVLVLGVVGGREPEGPTAPARPRTATTEPLPLARVDRVTADVPVVTIRPADETRFSVYEPVTGLVPGAVVRVRAEGFGWSARGRVEQCVSELGRQTACAEAFPVQFDDRGRADFQFAVRGDVAPGGCRVGQATCLLRLTDARGQVGTVQTVLVDSVATAQIRVEPAGRVTHGQTVQLSVTGFPAGTTAVAVLCVPPDAYDARRCTSPSPASTFTVDATGAGRTTLVVAAGRLGADAVVCGPRGQCGVAVVVGPGFVAAPVAPLAFSAAPGVAYEGGRLARGLAIAVALGAIAVVVAVRTDWSKPTEAETPELDAADLRAGADLDELFGTDAELDARDPIPW
jgi:hypothetical protein